MTKRGQLVIKFIIILIISVVLVLFFPAIGEIYGKREIYKKTIAAREIALLIDTLYAYPFDATVYYEKDLTGLAVEFSEQNVMVYDARLKNFDPAPAKYHFSVTGATTIKVKIENPKAIKFEKIKNNLIVSKYETINEY